MSRFDRIVSLDEALALHQSGAEVFGFFQEDDGRYSFKWIGDARLKDLSDACLVATQEAEPEEKAKAPEKAPPEPAEAAERASPDKDEEKPAEAPAEAPEAVDAARPDKDPRTLPNGDRSQLSTFEMYQLRQKGLTLEQIAEKAGVSASTVSTRLKRYQEMSAAEAVRSMRRASK